MQNQCGYPVTARILVVIGPLSNEFKSNFAVMCSCCEIVDTNLKEYGVGAANARDTFHCRQEREADPVISKYRRDNNAEDFCFVRRVSRQNISRRCVLAARKNKCN